MALVAQARKTEQEAEARVAAGEEEHVELSQREMTSVVGFHSLGESEPSVNWL
jgi:hypothetical protein